MKVKNAVLKDLTGKNPLRGGPSEHDEVLTLAKILQIAALAPQANQNEQRDAKQVLKRFMFAMEMEKLSVDEEFELDLDLYMEIRPDLLRGYTTVAAGQVMMLVENPDAAPKVVN
jgi:hypothetical protein